MTPPGKHKSRFNWQRIANVNNFKRTSDKTTNPGEEPHTRKHNARWTRGFFENDNVLSVYDRHLVKDPSSKKGTNANSYGDLAGSMAFIADAPCPESSP